MKDKKTGREETQRMAESTKVQENQREDKHAFKKFIIVLVLATIGGGIAGFVSEWSSEYLDRAAGALLSFLTVTAPYGNLFVTVLLLLWYGIVFRRLRKQFLMWDGEDEEVITGIEDRLTWGIIATGVATILTFFFLAAGFYVLDLADLDMYDIMTPIKLAILLGGAVCAMVVNTVLQKEIVNLTKEINPEKHGSVYDMRFGKTWMKSFDEAELAQSYRAGFYAFQMGNYTCIILSVFCFLGMSAFDFGIAPVVMVLIIWLVQTVSYGVKCLSKNTKMQSE